MKSTFFILLTLLFTTTAVAQEDVPMFEAVSPATQSADCPTCKGAKKMPNVGSGARKVDSVKFAPALPAIDVEMDNQTDSASRPFAGQQMKYSNSRYIDSAPSSRKTSSNLTKPVDFSEQSGKEIKIVPVEEKKEEAKVDTAAAKKIETSAKNDKNAKTAMPKLKKNGTASAATAPNPALQNARKIAQAKKVETFNIADLKLGMEPEDIIETAEEKGFELTNVAYGIPSFMVTDFERECRAGGLYQTRLIHECMRETARENDVYYISQLVFERKDSKEKMVVLFSSTLTNNKAFKIDYTAFGDNSLGTSYKDLLKKTNRRDIFWKYVFEKYGRPSEKEMLFWGSPNGVYMKAFLSGNSMDGRIVLEDLTQTGVDYQAAEKIDKEKDPANPFNF